MSADGLLIGVVNGGSSLAKFSPYKGEAIPAPDITRASPAAPADALLLPMPWLRDHIDGSIAIPMGFPALDWLPMGIRCGASDAGVNLAPDANAADGPPITRPNSRVAAYLTPTDENRMIARHTSALIAD